MRLSQLVLSIDENDPETLASVGWAKAYITAILALRWRWSTRRSRSIPVHPSRGAYRGITCVFVGRTEDAIQSLERAMRLSPLDPMLYTLQAFMAFAFINLRRFDDAVAAAEKSLHKKQNFMLAHRCHVAALAHLGRDIEAKQAAVRLLEHEPDFRMSIWANRTRRWPTKLLAEGLHKAGLPE